MLLWRTVDFPGRQALAIVIGSALIAAIGSARAVIHAQPALRFFVGYENCLAIEDARELTVGTKLTALTGMQTPRSVTVASVEPTTRTGLPPARGPNASCDSLFRDYAAVNPDTSPGTIAAFGRASDLPDDFGVCFALATPDAIVIGGAPVSLGPTAARRLMDSVRRMLRASWPRARMLVRAYRYPRTRGHQAIELYVGLPVLNARGSFPPIARIAIQRFYVIDGLATGFERYERTSGREERAETEAPQLTYDNWSRSDTERTVAFVSGDDARTWERLSTDVGFEGVHWVAQALRPGMPVIFHRYLYTTH